MKRKSLCVVINTKKCKVCAMNNTETLFKDIIEHNIATVVEIGISFSSYYSVHTSLPLSYIDDAV